MHRRIVLAALPLLLLTTAAAPRGAPRAPAAPPVPPPAAALADTVRVTLTTELGPIVIDLDGKHAPVSTANFLRYVDLRRFDGIAFYRSMHLDWGTPPNGLIQAGLRGDPRKVLKPIAHEPTSQTGLTHKAGAISMARFAPGTATADFSIMVSDMTGLDANPQATDPETQAGYAVFGQVVEGMDVVRRIWDAPISPTAGEGGLKGQMIEKPVKVLTVRRTPAPAPASP
ncbi:peptidylprolyl isomerase [Novosphingobium huizhouense]|uniref:peptidylprolyl isomerase n=1 Tax=Novosphingobium huizhouense TaxID=2866625 RepID=UPI001CD8C54B|nr:peptidylprolyl isomerase [Novosphingobium huizhouense]